MTRRFFCKVILVAVAIFALLALSSILLAQGRSGQAFERVKEVQERHTKRLMEKEGVEGTAIGLDENDELAVKVFTARRGVGGIPKTLDGVPVQVVVTGKFYALSAKGRFDRPVPIGVSTGNQGECSAGTIGCRVTDGTNVYALSNNHVYALENDAPIDSEVLQPGLYDTGCVYNADNVIGTLSDFEPIVFSTSANNVIDAAIALTTKNLVGNATPDDGYGMPKSSTVEASLLQSVQKYGRTTGLTSGIIVGVNMTVNVGYSSGVARFVDQIAIAYGNFSKPGDSGSLVVTYPGKEPVGLLFAGSTYMTVANPIDEVLSRFDVTVDDSEGPVDNPPTVDITSPSDDATFDYGVTISFAGTASDTEDGDLTPGIVWTSSIDGQIGTGGSFSTTLSDGTHTITASVTDSGGKTGSDSVTITVEPPTNNAPTVSITGPADGSTFDSGASISFEGTATDTEDGDLTASLVWTSDKDGQIGTGGSFSTTLGDGTHTITASVTDSGGKAGSDSISITVGAPLEEPTTVSVDSINYATRGGKDGKKHLLIDVILVDNLGAPVAGASVSILLTNISTDQAWIGTETTGTDGTAAFRLSNAPSGYYTTWVTEVIAGELYWDPFDPNNWSEEFWK